MSVSREESGSIYNRREVNVMNRKRILWISGALLAALLVAGLFAVNAVFAQEPTPPTPDEEVPFGRGGMRGAGRRGFGRGFSGRGSGRGFFGGGEDRWATFDTLAEALGLTPVELFTELHAGRSLDEIAEEQGVDLEEVQEVMSAARTDQMEERIAQAVEDGLMSEEQAEWLLEGIEQGYGPMGGGFGRGRGGCFGEPPGDE